jgi:predicted DNA-binding ribbon-helix-helix protein
MKSPAWGRGAHRNRRRWVGWGGGGADTTQHRKGTRRRTIIRSRAAKLSSDGFCPLAPPVAPLANVPIVPLRGAAFWGGRFMKGQQQNSPVTKRSIVIAGHKTSISLENHFWDALREIATAQGITTGALVASINAEVANIPTFPRRSAFSCSTIIDRRSTGSTKVKSRCPRGTIEIRHSVLAVTARRRPLSNSC